LTSNPNATNFNSLYTDRFNNKWIGTDDNGLFLFNENNIPTNINVTTNDGLNNNFVTSLVLDNNNELWIGTKAGINIINNINNPKSSVRRVYGMRNQIINQILIDNANRKWVATKTGGLFLLSSDGNEIISNFNSTNSPLISDNVLSIALDNDKGILYISTEYGIFSYNTNVTKSSLNYNLRVYPNPYLSKSNETITIDGLVSNSIVKIYNLNMELVKELPQINSGKITWDGKDKDGNILNTGIYFIVASDLQNNVAIQKLAVIK
jgi:ligand-binding sensor domain-containing protein